MNDLGLSGEEQEEFTALSVRERVKCMCHVGLSGMAKMC